MIDPKFVDLLICPDTRQSLRLAPDDVVADLNRQIEAGTVVNQGEAKVEERLDGGLVREDGKMLYPIFDEVIPELLVESGISVDVPAFPPA